MCSTILATVPTQLAETVAYHMLVTNIPYGKSL
jgi:hypothetical protein